MLLVALKLKLVFSLRSIVTDYSESLMVFCFSKQRHVILFLVYISLPSEEPDIIYLDKKYHRMSLSHIKLLYCLLLNNQTLLWTHLVKYKKMY